MNEVVKNYYLGLDIGTNSVGWAVTDDEYNLCKFKKKDMWGIRLFGNGKTAADRRERREEERIDANNELICYRCSLQKKWRRWMTPFSFD